MTDVYVRLLPLPQTVSGVTVSNGDDTYSVYINNRLCEAKRNAALDHELRHIKENHLYDLNPVWINEAEVG